MKPSLPVDFTDPTRAGHHPERAVGSGWENGELIATTAPGTYGGEQPDEVFGGPVFDVGQLLEILMLGARDADAVGERAVLLSFLLKDARGPTSLRQLGLWLDCNHVTAKKRLTTFQADFVEQIRGLLASAAHR